MTEPESNSEPLSSSSSDDNGLKRRVGTVIFYGGTLLLLVSAATLICLSFTPAIQCASSIVGGTLQECKPIPVTSGIFSLSVLAVIAGSLIQLSFPEIEQDRYLNQPVATQTSSVNEEFEYIRKEASETLNHQIQSLREERSDSLKIFRLNLVIAGAVITSIGIVTGRGIDISTIANIYTFAGIAALSLSTALTFIGFSTIDYGTAFSSGFIEKAFEEKHELWQFRSLVVSSYLEKLEKNSDRQQMAALIIGTSGIFTIVSLYLSAWGIYSPLFQ